MTDVAISILRMLEKKGDASLEEISKLIPKIHGDHRDFYVFASLNSRGLVEDPFISDSQSEKLQSESKVQVLSWKYFAMSTAEKRVSYKNMTWFVSGENETLKGQRFALSGAGHLYLSELATKRFDRAVALGSGIVIGIVVALAAVLIERYAKGT